MNVVAVLRLLIIRCTAERRDIFHTHSSVANSNVEFVHEVCPNHEFGELEGHQWLDLIREVLNEDCLEGFIV